MCALSPVQDTLLSALPLTARRILVLGASDGTLCRAFKARVPSAHWTAVAYDAETAGRLGDADAVVRGALSDHSLPWAPWRAQFDCVVLEDGFDESVAPVAALRVLSDCLTSGGVLVTRVPHAGHWTALRALLCEAGSASNSRSRAFTAEGIVCLLRNAGMVARKVNAHVETPLDAAACERAIAPLVAWAGGDAERAAQRLRTSDFIVCATRAAAPEFSASMPRLGVAMLAMAPLHAEVRTHLPLRAMASLPGVDVHYLERQGALPSWPADQPKVLIVQRQLITAGDEWARTIKNLHTKGWAVVAEWDDHPDLFPPAVKARFDEAPWGSVKAADAVQTSTPTLASIIRDVRGDDKVAVFDNRLLELPPIASHAGSNRSPDIIASTPQGTARLGFAAFNRTDEGVAMVRAITPILARWPHARLTIVHDRAVFDACLHPNKKFLPVLSYKQYQAEVAEWDIALLPLAPSLPNECKSDVKWVECAAHEVACIASPTVYGRTLVPEQTGLLADSPLAFAEAVERLLADPELRIRLGRQARAAVAAERMLAQDLERRVAWYEQVWNASLS